MSAPIDRQIISVGSASSTLSATLGQAALSGSVLTAHVSSRNGNSAAPTNAGWVLVVENEITNTTTTRLYAYRCVGGETSVPFTVTGTSTHRHSLLVTEWTGCAGTTAADAVDVFSTNNEGVNSVAEISTGTTATTAIADSVAVAYASADGLGKTFTTPTAEAYALIGSIRVSTVGSSTGQDAGVYLKTLNAVGTQNTTIAWTGSTGRARSSIVVLKGISGGTPPEQHTISATGSSEGTLTNTFFATPGTVATGSSTGTLTSTLSAIQTVSATGSSEGTLSATTTPVGGSEQYTVSATGSSLGTLTTAFTPLLVIQAQSESVGTLTALLESKYFFTSSGSSEGVLVASISGIFNVSAIGSSEGTLTTITTIKGEGGSGPAPSFVLINNRLRLIF